MDNLIKDITDKLPNQEQFRKDKASSVSYIFMLIFFLYFFYNEFLKRDDCGQKIEGFEKVILQKDQMINQLNNRVGKLETALDVKTGVLQQVEEKLVTGDLEQGGGQ